MDTLEENGGAILEVNAAPGFRMHIDPTEGLPSNVAEPVIDMLISSGKCSNSNRSNYWYQWKNNHYPIDCSYCKKHGNKVGYTTADGFIYKII